jgi:hypothetical protein
MQIGRISGPCGGAIPPNPRLGRQPRVGVHLVEVPPPSPSLYKERQPLPHYTPLAFASVPRSPSLVVPKYWNEHMGFEISMRTPSCVAGSSILIFSSSVALLDRSSWDVVYTIRVYNYGSIARSSTPPHVRHAMTLRPASQSTTFVGT